MFFNSKYHNSWNEIFQKEFSKPYFQELKQFIQQDIEKFGEIRDIYPPNDLIYNAFDLCSFEDIKVVIIGQDPYINPKEAMGLCFSVPKGIKIPPSLKNIYKELLNDEDVEFDIPDHGDLTNWGKQGVLLLNASLTVRQGKSNSHAKIWKPFTDNIIKYISDNKTGIIFVLWGNFAKGKKTLISDKHHILESIHPSPLSVNRNESDWFGNCHFSKINTILEKSKRDTINWNGIQ